MIRIKRAVCVAATLGILATCQADAATKRKANPKGPACVSEATMSELAFRQMQSELMTAALSCGQPYRDAYTALVEENRPTLALHGAALKRAMGKKTDRLVTQAANTSARTLDCANVSAVYAQYEQRVPLDSISSDLRFRDMTGYRVCSHKIAKQ